MKYGILHILFIFIIHTTGFAQEMRIVSGIIKDNDNYPIPGVNIVEKGTTKGMVTDINGYYEIKVPLGSTLQFSFVGMKSSEMVVTESNSKPVAGSTATRIKPNPTPMLTPPLKGNKIDAVTNEHVNEWSATRDDRSLSPYFLVISDSPKEAWMPLKNTDVAVNIAGVIADVCVKQIYINKSVNTLEAVYVFPGSTRAAVYGMSMTVGDRRIDARIKKKEQARQEYEQAKEEGKSTTLLEQHRPNVFQMNVANILPGDTIVVEMRYTELLEHLDGQYEFVYPTVVGPRYTETGEQWVEQATAQGKNGTNAGFSINTVIQAGMPIRKVSSSSHSLTIESVSPDIAVIL